MVLKGPPTQRLQVAIITTHFQINGQLETIGTPFSFINDAARESLPLYEVNVTPLATDTPLKSFSLPHVIIRRSKIEFLYFESAETRASIQTLRRSELLVAYTSVAVCRGNFHMADEANVGDFIEDIASVLLPVTEARIFSFSELTAPFPTDPELVLIGRSHLQFYHPA